MNIKVNVNKDNSMIGKHMSKNEMYDYLIAIPKDKLNDYIVDINEYYGYECINKYELARYEIVINNKVDALSKSNEEIDFSSMLGSTRKHRSKQECNEIKKDLQKAYMKLLAGQ